MRLAAAVLVVLSGRVWAAEPTPVLNQVSASASASRSGALSSTASGAAAGARDGFGEATGGAAPVDLSGGVRRSARTYAAAAPASNIYAANTNVPRPAYAAQAKDDDKNTWDRDGVIKSLPAAAAGALIGFMLGGPIGACAGFLAGFFLGAAAWHFGGR